MIQAVALLALAAVVKASPFAAPQAVTSDIAPAASAPAGCSGTFTGSFGIAVQNVSSTAVAKRQVTQISDGQPQVQTMAPVSMITDGQIQGGYHTMMMMAVSQIGDGQIQGPTQVAPVTVISDGQPQAPAMTVAPVTESSEGQPEAPVTTAVAVTESSEGQPEAPTSTVPPVTTAPAVSESSEGQPEATATATSAAPAAASSSGSQLVACDTPGTLAITLEDGVLKDAKGRTGYIASNFQFQFDGPPQAGAIYTAGFSVCANGSLALGGSNVFYQCLSGDFYNLYDRFWAAQCSPVYINTLALQQCS